MITFSTALSQTVTATAVAGENTYARINSFFAPNGGDVCETPDCAHPDEAPHIRMVYDNDLQKYVFAFYAHVHFDNDRCQKFDRQRVEIKTYSASPSWMLGYVGDSVRYEWSFKIPVGFQPSANFTHIHQIKPVGGGADAELPIFTLTCRKGKSGKPNKMELRWANDETVKDADLSLFEGVWVDVTEAIRIDPVNGQYKLLVKNHETGATILSYTNNKLMTIKPMNDYIRPKWGIYRSLLDSTSLRDEVMWFDNVKVRKVQESSENTTIIEKKNSKKLNAFVEGDVLNLSYFVDKNLVSDLEIVNMLGQVILQKNIQNDAQEYVEHSVYVGNLPIGVYVAKIKNGNNIFTEKFVIR
ncbi:hypothetical protein FACS1894153_1430 [Bacteroidia bacterium]|nr:hypothetical protein FACS1894153_1430 [Bacteroidia bacterium]